MGTRKCTEDEVITALMAASSITEAARLLGVSRRTVYNYLASEDFEAKLIAARDEQAKRLEHLRETATVKAVEKLLGILDDFWTSDRERIEAAKVLLNFTGRRSEVA